MKDYIEAIKEIQKDVFNHHISTGIAISDNVQDLLDKRYFMNLYNGKKETSYTQLCERVSRVIASAELATIKEKNINLNNESDRDELLKIIRNTERSIYTDMITGNFLFNSPCLFSAGTGLSATEHGHLLYDNEITLEDYEFIYNNKNNKSQMLFACFVIGIEDSIEGIYDAVKNTAVISRYGGGVGINFSPIREKNASIDGGICGIASGPVSFAGNFNAMGDSIVQGGKRRVALMGMLNVNHPDINEFIHCKTEEGVLTNFNISVALDDKFMEAVYNNSDYELKAVVDGHVVRTVKARELWNSICENAHKKGDPGIFFIDLANKDSLLRNCPDFEIHGTNPSLVAGTKVLTCEGIFNIEELEGKNFTVPTMVNTASDAVCILSGENKHVFKIKFSGGFEVSATDEHKWPVLRNNEITKVTTAKLVKGDLIPRLEFRENLNFGNMGNRDEGFYLGTLYNYDKPSVNTEFCEHFGNITGPFDSLPEFIWNKVTDDFRKGFIDAVFSQNCEIDIDKKRISLLSKNEKITKEIGQLLGFYGIRYYLHYKDNVLYSLDINSNHCSLFRRLIGKLSNEQKNEDLCKIPEPIRFYDKSNYVKVNDIIDDGIADKVWDLQVNDFMHTFGLSGLYTGNCGEQNLPDFTSCNLGSINLDNFVINKQVDDNEDERKVFDGSEFIRMIQRGIYYLDLVIDATAYPLDIIQERTMKIRPVGLGIMGLADSMIRLGYKYGNTESFNLTKEIGKFLAGYSLIMSVKLGKIKGSFKMIYDDSVKNLLDNFNNLVNYESTYRNINIAQVLNGMQYDKSFDGMPISFITALYNAMTMLSSDDAEILWNDIFNNYYLRNSRRLSIAPTGTISMILNTSSSIEPNFAFEWKRNITDSDGKIVSKLFKHKYVDIENKDLLVTANELTADKHIAIVRCLAKYCDSGISKCVAKGTQIQTNQGIINIENFGNPDKDVDTFEDISDKNIMVRDMNGDWKKVLSHYYGGKKKTLKLSFQNGFVLECSENHKLMTQDGWKKAADIVLHEFICVREFNKSDCSDSYVLFQYITNIEESFNDIYDIEVEDTHSYLISGIVSHNTVNLPNSATVKDVQHVYEQCYDSGIKGITIYRDGSRDGQTLQKIEKEETIDNKIKKDRDKIVMGFTQKGETNYGNLYATLNVVDGKPYELFINIGKSGSLAKSLSEALSRTISISLQNGVDIKQLIKTLNGIADSDTPWVFEDYKGEEYWCKSIPDMIAKMMKSLNEYVIEYNAVHNDKQLANNTSNDEIIKCAIEHDKYSTDKKRLLCPECLKNGNEVFLAQIAGCNQCLSCGWSACS